MNETPDTGEALVTKLDLDQSRKNLMQVGALRASNILSNLFPSMVNGAEIYEIDRSPEIAAGLKKDNQTIHAIPADIASVSITPDSVDFFFASNVFGDSSRLEGSTDERTGTGEDVARFRSSLDTIITSLKPGRSALLLENETPEYFLNLLKALGDMPESTRAEVYFYTESKSIRDLLSNPPYSANMFMVANAASPMKFMTHHEGARIPIMGHEFTVGTPLVMEIRKK